MGLSTDFFANLVTPVAPDEFFSRYWEKDYLHLERDRPGLYDDLFSLGDVDRWLLSTRTGDVDAALLVPPGGSDVAVQRFRAGELPVDRAYEALAGGHTLILNQIEKSWPKLSPLIERLGEVFCARIGVNAYLTPKGSRAFPLHIDNQDSFILQVSGEKVWQLHDLDHLPAQLEYGQDLAAAPLWDRLEAVPHRAEICLRPGDLLYLPRGMPHCAVARDAPSLHLTVSITCFHWVDLLKVAVEQASFTTPALRRVLPPRFVSNRSIQEAMQEEFAEVLRAFEANAAFEPTLTAILRRRLRLQGYPQDGHIEQVLRLSELTGESQLERRPGVLVMVDDAPGKSACRLRFAGSFVQGPERLRRAMEFVRDRERLRVDELPGIDPQGQVVFARRLVRLGLLRLVSAECGQ